MSGGEDSGVRAVLGVRTWEVHVTRAGAWSSSYLRTVDEAERVIAAIEAQLAGVDGARLTVVLERTDGARVTACRRLVHAGRWRDDTLVLRAVHARLARRASAQRGAA